MDGSRRGPKNVSIASCIRCQAVLRKRQLVKRFPGLLAERMIVLAVLPHKLRSMFDGHAMVVPQIVQPLLFSGKDADQKECWTVHLSEDVNFLGSLQSQEDVCGSFHRFR